MMGKKIPPIALGMLVLSFTMTLCAATPQFSDEIFAAKSMAVVVTFVQPSGVEPSDFKELLRTRAEEKIREKKRFQLVAEPSQADLICLLVMYQPSWAYKKNDPVKYPTKYVATALGSSVILFKGGANTHWDAAPVWMATVASVVALYSSVTDHHRDILDYFHKQLQKAEKSPRPAKGASEGATAGAATRLVPERNIFLTCFDFCPAKQASQIRAIAEAHWNVVNDPSQADIIAIWFGEDFSYEGLVATFSQTFGSLLIYKGARESWNPTPVAAASGQSAVKLFTSFAEWDASTFFNSATPSFSNPTRSNLDFGLGSSSHVLTGLSVDAYTKIILGEPGNADAFNERGKAYRAIGEFDHAIRDFAEAIRLRPFFLEAKNNLEEAKQAKGKSACGFQIVCK